MTRVDLRAWSGLLLAGTILTYVGCSSSTSTASKTGSSSNSASTAAPTPAAAPAADAEGGKSGKLFANWPKSLAAVLVVSGQMDGYLEPCGCTKGQLGGLIRRYEFVERLRSQYPVALIDLGSLINDPAAARGGFEQAKIKFGVALKAYNTLKYDAIALSADDLKVGVSEAFAQYLNNLGDATKILSANVSPGAGFESRFEKTRIITAGPVKIGVTAVVDPETLEKLTDPDKADLLPTIERPDDVVGVALAEMEAKSDYQVLMVQGSPDQAKRLALAYPGFDVVVSTSQFADPLEREQKLNGDKTLLVHVGRRGKHIGAIGIFPGDAEKMRFYLYTLNSRNDGPGTAMKKVIEDEYRSMLKSTGIVENFPRHDYVNATSGATYVGAETCKRCHPNTFMKWSTTKHAQAFTALVNDPKPDTMFDAECVTCHTTGFEYTSGWRSEVATPQLKGNQCENCHGPGSKHVSEPTNLAFRQPMKLTAEQADKNRLCIRCHDEDNSPEFEFAKYWGQVVHKALDDYTDPKVRVGISPKVARNPGSSSSAEK
jgi:hypothetical protein